MRLASSTTFDSFILLVILGNCVMMASSSPLVEEPEIYHTLEVVCMACCRASCLLSRHSSLAPRVLQLHPQLAHIVGKL